MISTFPPSPLSPSSMSTYTFLHHCFFHPLYLPLYQYQSLTILLDHLLKPLRVQDIHTYVYFYHGSSLLAPLLVRCCHFYSLLGNCWLQWSSYLGYIGLTPYYLGYRVYCIGVFFVVESEKPMSMGMTRTSAQRSYCKLFFWNGRQDSIQASRFNFQHSGPLVTL
ncbi:hypothetical protein P691DRAFT_252143 [Macrolepiota fuliginosa MF-IS2]|uniref:Uncharacterized protein n=1 Tax=Macrolepiota fuliginosa MF-IS2 TaxID=1400762 RepID=A0A9P5X789_9AGAR|nr:hypothetical protein P691DRAFT_252143 [Macrolepiota fuliginosa MF-IS2]